MYTDKEKATARHIVESEDIRKLLQKVFTTPSESLNPEVVASKTNEQLGEIVRAESLAEQKILIRWQELVRIGQPKSDAAAKETAPE